MPIYSDNNRFPGINPHLNSALQERGGGWERFHAYHIAHLAEKLNTFLPSDYSATLEKALQTRVYNPQLAWVEPTSGNSIPDVLVPYLPPYPDQPTAPPVREPSKPTLTLPIARLLDDDEDELMAVMIRRGGKLVTQIELLTPASKPYGSHFGVYLAKRASALSAGIRLIEIDYLQQQHPIDNRIPSYAGRQSNAFPYLILVTDPNPTLEKGKMDVYGSGALESLPVINIPLEGRDVVLLDFGEVYNYTVTGRLFSESEDISYLEERRSRLPYSKIDLMYIRRYMAIIDSEEKRS